MTTAVQPLTLLLIEDHPGLADNICEFMALHGHHVHCAGDGGLGLQMALQAHYDLVLLDLNLPVLDGLKVCRALRAQAARRVPVLMLTARDQLQDKLAGFAEGADDYLTKPFALAELLARCQALAQRPLLHGPLQLQVGPLVIDLRRHEAQREGRRLALSPLGYRLLRTLAEAWPAAVSKEVLCQRLWGDEWPESDALRSHIYQLRQVLDRPFDWPMLHTVPGVGFRLEAAP